MVVAPTRTACVWCPDWSVTAAVHADPGLISVPVAVIGRGTRGGTVIAASTEARAAGVTAGLRRREAEARCAALVLLEHDPDRDGRAFEAVARVVETFTPRLVVDRPGRLSFPTRGPARYFGGDETLGVRVLTALRDAGTPRVRLGIADGGFTAWLAARVVDHAAVDGHPMVVGPGESGAFLAPRPVRVLGDPDLVGLLHRLGVRTLGAFAALPAADVVARFGASGALAHRRAAGMDDEPLALVDPPPEFAVVHEFDPPEARLDAAAFAAKALADRFLAALDRRGLACTRVVIEAETEHDEIHTRTWRHDGALTPAALAARARWQLDAWLTEAGVRSLGTTGGLIRLRYTPEQVIPTPTRQLGLWGTDAATHDRAAGAFARLQAMHGHDAVVTALRQGGRTPAEQVRWVPWGSPREPESGRALDAPWPGALLPPAPTRVFTPPVPVELLDDAGCAVGVSSRGECSAAPAWLRWPALPPGRGAVLGWAGPWAQDVRWWDRRAHRRCVLWQLVVDAGPDREVACLVAVERGRAALEALYD